MGSSGRRPRRAGERSKKRANKWPHLALEAGGEKQRTSDGTRHLKEMEAANSARSLEQERENTSSLARQATAVRQERPASTEQHRQAFEEERARAVALASELATAKQRDRDPDCAVAKGRKMKPPSRSRRRRAATAELRQSLQQEQKKTTALMQDAKAAQAMTAAA